MIVTDEGVAIPENGETITPEGGMAEQRRWCTTS